MSRRLLREVQNPYWGWHAGMMPLDMCGFTDANASCLIWWHLLQATDIAMLADMAKYMRNDYSSLPSGYSAANFPHANMPNMFWWDWNANSGDTGGLVQNDWLTVTPSCLSAGPHSPLYASMHNI